MKNRFIVIYTIFASAVFIFAVSFFGFNLFREYQTNLEKSDKKFTELTSDIRTLSFNQENNNAAYSKGIKDSIGDVGAYSYIQVRRNNETVVLYPTGKSREETVSKLTKAFTTSITVNKQSVTIDCNLYLIRPDSIFYYARVSFLMILIITIITIIMIIYLNVSENTSDVISIEEDSEELDETEIEEETDEDVLVSEEKENNEASSDTEEEGPRDIPDYFDETGISEESADSNAAAEETSEAQVSEEPSSENHAEVTPEEVKAILAEPLTDEAVAASASASEPAKLPVDEVKPATVTQASADTDSNEPSGLYNPETGIGWESYLSTRLNNEIDRATASEIDLSLFIIKLSEVPKTNEAFKNVCNYLAIQFQFKDLLFEFKDDCIVAIKISMNVDEALNLADKLYHDICNIINGNNCRIGISSRSIRMVTGERLILEAEQAIEHSDQSSPVIAFRVDSEKYRQLMEQNQ